MKEAGNVVSEVRASFMDLMTYLMPGGFLLLLVLESAGNFLARDIVWHVASVYLAAARGGSLPILTALMLLALSYVLGLLLRAVEDLVPRPVRASWLSDDLGFRALKKHAQDNWDWSEQKPEVANACRVQRWHRVRKANIKDSQDLYGRAETLVLERASRAEVWVERYCALANLCAGLKWAALLGLPLYALSIRGLPPEELGHHVTSPLLLIIVPAVLFVLVTLGQLNYEELGERVLYAAAADILSSAESSGSVPEGAPAAAGPD